jgi:hypothetical protein
MHHNRGYGTINVEVDTLSIFINGKSEAMVQPQRPKRRRQMGSFEGKFCRTFFLLAWISDLRCEIILFKQKEGESLGTAWDRFTNILASGPI